MRSIRCGLLLQTKRGLPVCVRLIALSVTRASCAKTAEPIEMLLSLWTRGCTESHVLSGDEARITPHTRDTFGGSVLVGPAQTCRRSIFSTVFVRGQQRCGPWLPVQCSNLFILPAHPTFFSSSGCDDGGMHAYKRFRRQSVVV